MKLTAKWFWGIALFLGYRLDLQGQNLPAAAQYPGIHAKAGSGAGLTISRGPGAIFLNPANIIFSKFIEPDADLGFSMTNYTYTPLSESYDIATTSLTALQMTFGATVRPILPLALSAGVVPSLSSSYTLESAPYYLGGGVYEPSTVSVTQEALRFGGAAAYKVLPILTLGVGVILTNEKSAITATKPQETEPFLDMLYGGSYTQFMVGARSDLLAQRLSLAFTFKSAAAKNFSGDYYLDTATNKGGDYIPLDYKGYAPATIGVGGEMQFASFGGYGDLRYNQWQGGSASRGISTAPTESDLKNNFEVSGGGKLWLMKDHMLMGGIGFITPNIGDGTDNTFKANEALEGMGLGDVDGIQRLIFSAGYRFRLKNKGYVMAGGQYQTGSREVPEGYSYEGTHSLSVLMGSIGGAYGF